MEKAAEYVKRHFKAAWKSVFFNFRQYLCFFLAILIVEVLYGMMTVSNANNDAIEFAHIREEYDYHMALKGLNAHQAAYLIENESPAFRSNKLFDIVGTEEYKNEFTGEPRYDFYLYFLNDADRSLTRFEQAYQPNLQALGTIGISFTKSPTPLLNYKASVDENRVTFFFVTLILMAVCIFLLASLYKIRVNHYKFQYGVYLTFGANFSALFSTAFWELFVIMIVTFIPSMLLSTLISYLIYRSSGFPFIFSAASVLWVFLFTLAVIAAAVWMPMRLMAVKTPMSLIITEDNSNLVTSPMRSLSIFGEKFPQRYELYSFWRFRKYGVQLLTTAIVFCALFIMGLYVSDIYATTVEYPKPEFVLNLKESGFEYDEQMSEELYAMDGVRLAELCSNTVEAIQLSSHMLVKSDAMLPFKNPVHYQGTEFDTGGESWCVSNEVRYVSTPAEQLPVLEQYEYDGDLSCLGTPGMIVIGDSVSNVKQYDFKVGDTVWIARKTGQMKEADYATGRALHLSQLRYFHFAYTPFTIGAIVYDVPGASTPVYMNPDDYTAVTMQIPLTTLVNVYVEEDLPLESVKDLYAELRQWAHEYGDIKVSNHNTTLERAIERDKHYSELVVCIALLILCISPLVWFFSQSLYYTKREKEFNILQSLGAVKSEIKSIYLRGGLFMAALSLVVSILLSYAGSYLVFLCCNVLIPKFYNIQDIRYTFYMPWYVILTSVIVSVACGFFSAYLPYRSYYKHRYSLGNGGAGGEYGEE